MIRTENVIAVLAHFADCDGLPADAIEKKILLLGLRPHLGVQSNPGKWHIYWFVDGVPLSEFNTMQARLVDRI